MTSRQKRATSIVLVSIYALLSVIAVTTSPWGIDASGGPSDSFQSAANDFTSTESLGPSVFKVNNRYASEADTELFVNYLLLDGNEIRLTDLPLSGFIPCSSDFLCDTQGRMLYWIIPIALRQPWRTMLFTFVLARAISGGGSPEDPLLILDQTALLGSAHDTPDCDLSGGDAHASRAIYSVEPGWVEFNCAGPPLLASTLAHWLVHGCRGLEAWKLCDQAPTSTGRMAAAARIGR